MIPLWENHLTLPPRIDYKRKEHVIVQFTGNCLCNIPKLEPHRERFKFIYKSLPTTLPCMTEGEVGHVSIVGKHILGKTNLAFDNGSKRDF
jgi:hypothetical protein